jgi:hypothetical protein
VTVIPPSFVTAFVTKKIVTPPRVAAFAKKLDFFLENIIMSEFNDSLVFCAHDR